MAGDFTKKNISEFSFPVEVLIRSVIFSLGQSLFCEWVSCGPRIPPGTSDIVE